MAIDLDDILEMSESELFEYIVRKCITRGIDFDPDMMDGSGKIAMYDFIAENINPEFQAELHSECQMTPGCSMFPNTETEDDLTDEMDHEFCRYDDE